MNGYILATRMPVSAPSMFLCSVNPARLTTDKFSAICVQTLNAARVVAEQYNNTDSAKRLGRVYARPFSLASEKKPA